MESGTKVGISLISTLLDRTRANLHWPALPRTVPGRFGLSHNSAASAAITKNTTLSNIMSGIYTFHTTMTISGFKAFELSR